MDHDDRIEYLDAAGYPDGTGFLDEGTRLLVDEVANQLAAHAHDVPLSAYDLQFLDDDQHHRFTAWVDGEEIAAMPYRIVAGRMVLLTATVREDFRGKGVATEFIAQVLDDVRQSGRKVTIYCPIVRSFLDRYPQYQDVLDNARPGVTSESVIAAAGSADTIPLVYNDRPASSAQ
jgi:predicted GNAT family acetyltransferase